MSDGNNATATPPPAPGAQDQNQLPFLRGTIPSQRLQAIVQAQPTAAPTQAATPAQNTTTVVGHDGDMHDVPAAQGIGLTASQAELGAESAAPEQLLGRHPGETGSESQARRELPSEPTATPAPTPPPDSASPTPTRAVPFSTPAHEQTSIPGAYSTHAAGETDHGGLAAQNVVDQNQQAKDQADLDNLLKLPLNQAIDTVTNSDDVNSTVAAQALHIIAQREAEAYWNQNAWQKGVAALDQVKQTAASVAQGAWEVPGGLVQLLKDTGTVGNQIATALGNENTNDVRDYLNQELKANRLSQQDYNQSMGYLKQADQLDQQAAQEATQIGPGGPVQQNVGLQKTDLIQKAAPVWTANRIQQATLNLAGAEKLTHDEAMALWDKTIGMPERWAKGEFLGRWSTDFKRMNVPMTQEWIEHKRNINIPLNHLMQGDLTYERPQLAQERQKTLYPVLHQLFGGEKNLLGIPTKDVASQAAYMNSILGKPARTIDDLAVAHMPAQPEKIQAGGNVGLAALASAFDPAFGAVGDLMAAPTLRLAAKPFKAGGLTAQFARKTGWRILHKNWKWLAALEGSGHWASILAHPIRSILHMLGEEGIPVTATSAKVWAAEKIGLAAATLFEDAAKNSARGRGFAYWTAMKMARTGAKELWRGGLPAAFSSKDLDEWTRTMGGIAALHAVFGMPGHLWNGIGAEGDRFYVTRPPKTPAPEGDLAYGGPNAALDAMSAKNAAGLDSPEVNIDLLKEIAPSLHNLMVKAYESQVQRPRPKFNLWTRVKANMEPRAHMYLANDREMAALQTRYKAAGAPLMTNPRGFVIPNGAPGGRDLIFINPKHFDDALPHEAYGHPYYYMLPKAKRDEIVNFVKEKNDPNAFAKRYTEGAIDYDSLPTDAEVKAGKPAGPFNLTKERMDEEMAAEYIGKVATGGLITDLEKEPSRIQKARGFLLDIADKLGMPTHTPEARSTLGIDPAWAPTVWLEQFLRDAHEENMTRRALGEAAGTSGRVGARTGARFMPMAGPSATGYEQAEREGRTFTGPLSLRPQFEISDRDMEWVKDKDGKPMISKVARNYPLPLEKVIDHPELFRNYPELRNLLVYHQPELAGHMAAYYMEARGGRPPSIGLTRMDKTDLAHELQHYVQDTEGYLKRGGPPPGEAVTESDYMRHPAEVEARVAESRLGPLGMVPPETHLASARIIGRAAMPQQARFMPREPGETGTEATPFRTPDEEGEPETSVDVHDQIRQLIEQGKSPGEAQAIAQGRAPQTLEQQGIRALGETGTEAVAAKEPEKLAAAPGPPRAPGQTGTEATVPKPSASAPTAELEPAGPKITGYQTAKGSTYQVHEDGTTTRNKAARPEHPGEEGPQPRSQRTVYLKGEDALRLAPPTDTKLRIVDHPNGTMSLITFDQDGRPGVAPSQRNVPYSTEPKIGWTPVELWGKAPLEGLPTLDTYNAVHFGNPITKLEGSELPKAAAGKAPPKGPPSAPRNVPPTPPTPPTPAPAPSRIWGPFGIARPGVSFMTRPAPYASRGQLVSQPEQRNPAEAGAAAGQQIIGAAGAAAGQPTPESTPVIPTRQVPAAPGEAQPRPTPGPTPTPGPSPTPSPTPPAEAPEEEAKPAEEQKPAVPEKQPPAAPGGKAKPAVQAPATPATGKGAIKNSVTVRGTEFGEIDRPSRGGYTEPGWNRGAWGADLTGKHNRGVALPAHVLSQFGNWHNRQFANNFNSHFDVLVINPKTGRSAIAPLKDAGPGAKTGAGIDMLYGTRADLGFGENFSGPVTYAIIPKGSAGTMAGVEFNANAPETAATTTTDTGAFPMGGTSGAEGAEAAPAPGVGAPPQLGGPEIAEPEPMAPMFSSGGGASGGGGAGGGMMGPGGFPIYPYYPQQGMERPPMAPGMIEAAGGLEPGFGQARFMPGVFGPGQRGAKGRRTKAEEEEFAEGEPESTIDIANPAGEDTVRSWLSGPLDQALASHSKSLSASDARVRKQLGGDNKFKGQYFQAGDLVHEHMLDQLPDQQQAVLGRAEQAIKNGQLMHMTYGSAPKMGLAEAEAPTRAGREVEYEMSGAQARAKGQAPQQLAGHSMVPVAIGIAPGKGKQPHQAYIQGISANTAANNHAHVNNALARLGIESPYPQLDQKFVNDMQGYISNLNAGHRGTGSGIQPATEAYPNPYNRNYIPYRLTTRETDFLNAVLNNQRAKTGSETALRELARKGGTLLTEKGETNPIREAMERVEPGWSRKTLEPTIRTFEAPLIHAFHEKLEDIPEGIRPGAEFKRLSEALQRHKPYGPTDIPIAARFMPRTEEEAARAKARPTPEPLTPEEHAELSKNIRKQFISGRLSPKEYQAKMAEVPAPGEPLEPKEEEPERGTQARFMPFAGPRAIGFGSAKRAGETFKSPLEPEGPERFEISDQNLKFKPAPPGSPYQNMLEHAYHFDPRGTGKIKLSQAISHPTLFDNYPALKDTHVTADPTIPTQGHYEYPETDEWTGKARGNHIVIKRPNDKPTLVHEIQHAIQYIEKFKGQGSSVEAERAKLSSDPTVIDELNKRYDDLEAKGQVPYAEAQKQRGYSPEEIFKGWVSQRLRNMAFARYQMDPGEIEARTAAARAEWPGLTKSVPPEEHIKREMGAAAREAYRLELPEHMFAGLEPGMLERGTEARFMPRAPISSATKRKLGPRPEEDPIQGGLWDRAAARLDSQIPEAIPLVPDRKENGDFKYTKTGEKDNPKYNPVYEKTDYAIANSPMLKKLGKALGTEVNQKTGKLGMAKAPKDVQDDLEELDPEKRLTPFLTPTDRKRVAHLNDISAVDAYADKLYQMYKGIEHLPEVMEGKDWYEEAEGLLRKHFGKHADLVANLLGATSAGNAVKINYNMAMEAYHQFLRGHYDDAIDLYRKAYAIKEGGKGALIRHIMENKIHEALGEAAPGTDEAAMEQYITHHGITPRSSLNRLFGHNSLHVLKVLSHTWEAEAGGPKTPNFAGNLSGRSLQATIDMWAARTMRRLGYEGHQKGPWLIQPAGETGVNDVDFGLGQLAFRKAAERIGIKPSSLQAILWFAEQKHWQAQGWEREQDPASRDYRPMLRSYQRPEDIPASAYERELHGGPPEAEQAAA